MPIISRVGRKHWRIRSLVALIYIVLILGAVTMVYPFLLMVSGSFKSNIDFNSLDPVPAYWFDDDLLFKKHIEAKYNEDLDAAKFTLELNLTSFEKTPLPDEVIQAGSQDWKQWSQQDQARVGDWLEWEGAAITAHQQGPQDSADLFQHPEKLKQFGDMPLWFRQLGVARSQGNKVVPLNLHLYKRHLQANYGGDLNNVNQNLLTHLRSWQAVVLPRVYWPQRRRMPEWNRMLNFFFSFRESRPAHEFFYSNVTGFYRFGYLKVLYTDIKTYNQQHDTDYKSFTEVPMPGSAPTRRAPTSAASQPAPATAAASKPGEPAKPKKLVDPAEDWERFVRGDLSPYFIRLVSTDGSDVEAIFRAFLKHKYTPQSGRAEDARRLEAESAGLALEEYNEEQGTSFQDWDEEARDHYNQTHGTDYPSGSSIAFAHFNAALPESERHADWFAAALAAYNRETGASCGDWDAVALHRYNAAHETDFQDLGAATQDNYNRTHRTQHADWDGISLPETYAEAPADGRSPVDWQDFLSARRPEAEKQYLLPVGCLRIDSPDMRFREHLQQKYGSGQAGLDKLNAAYCNVFDSWEAVAEPICRRMLKARYPKLEALKKKHGTKHENWDDISEQQCRTYLKAAYGNNLAALNDDYRPPVRSWDQISPPLFAADMVRFTEHTGEIRKEFTVRNYRMVFDYVLLHGRALLNTIILVVLTIVTHLTVNPLCAYALSRYNLPSTYKVLLFCMATMAFPHEVTMIPNFLLLKELGLLNTFAALVLPGMANGYFIFLLKGFFDSLPQELYESAQIDGAGEFRMFWTITMACSKPVLAVIALQSFQAAYTQFMFAFITCQDERMWTIMVWLYQLQLTAGPFVMFAALCIAAVPTLLVFILCQGVIMRGIIIPVEK